MRDLPPVESIEIAVRAYAPPPPRADARKSRRSWRNHDAPPPSAWTLTWDSEFSRNEAQQFTVGAYQVRNGGELVEKGLIDDPMSLTDADRATVYRYALDQDYEVREVRDFRR